MSQAAKRQKKYFDRMTKRREIKPGTKVLLLLPKKHNKLQLTWRGPYTVTQKTSPVDYKIKVDGKEKTYHVNLLKEYLERKTAEEDEVVAVVMQEEGDDEYQTHKIPLIPLQSSEGIKDVKIGPALDEKQRSQIKQVIKQNECIITDLPGNTNLVTCELKLTTDQPVRVHQYPVPYSQMDKVEEEVDQMLKMGVIEPASSPYNSPIVLVKKKDDTTRFCTDYRKLNLVTEFDSEPLPDIDAIFAKVGKAKYFSKIDLSKGFWQINMRESDRPKTAFSTPQGQFQWKRMPFGMKNASAVFSRMMRKLLKNINRRDVHNFLDDIIIATESWQEHVKAVKTVLEQLKMAGVTAKPSKCYFGFAVLPFLGHQVGSGSIQPEADKVQKIKAAQKPRTKKELRSFLGLAGYYRKFVPNYAMIAAPLTDLTKKNQPEKLIWNDASEQAFKTLKSKLTSEPIVRLPDKSKTYTLRTDASDKGLGAVLLQENEGILQPIAYASKKLSKAESSYATIEKECLAVIWAIKKFEAYLYGTTFVLETDHQPLQYLKRNKTTNGRLMRWAILLQDHDFTVRVIPGKDNIGADFLSRSTDTE